METSAHDTPLPFPIIDYDMLDIRQILALVTRLSPAEASEVAARERQTKGRYAVIEALGRQMEVQPGPVGGGPPLRAKPVANPTPPGLGSRTAPPWAAISPSPVGDGTSTLAGFWSRTGGVIIDTIIQLVIVAPFGVAAGVVAETPLYPLAALAVLAAYVGPSLWFGWLIGQSGQTPGMAMLGLKAVEAVSGGPVGSGRAVGRWAAFMGFNVVGGVCCLGLPFVGMLDVLWAAWDKQKQTLHDKVAGTVVINVASQPASLNLFKSSPGQPRP